MWRDWYGDVKKHPVFVLPGTHAGIFPWVPPPCGIPAEVLEGMRKGLLEILFEIACGGLSRSNQSSPALTHVHLPPLALSQGGDYVSRLEI